MGHPLVVSTETEEVEIVDIDFPGFTVSGSSGLKRSGIHDSISNYGAIYSGQEIVTGNESIWSIDDAVGVLEIIDQMCSLKTTHAGLNNVTNLENFNTKYMIITEKTYLYDNLTTEAMMERIIPFLQGATYDCSDVIIGCFLNEEPIDCRLLFKKRFSEWGNTCMFNGIPGQLTRKDSSIQTSLTEGEYSPEEAAAWAIANLDQDIGGEKSIGQEQPKINGRIRTPWRQTSPGKTSGLSFIIKENPVNKACVHGEGTGFMFTVNHPSDEPQIKRFGKSMPFGHEVLISVNPLVLLADDDIKEMEKEKRQCYFSDDNGAAELQYYRKYTKKNCFHECIADQVAQKCKCTSFVAPEEMYDRGMRASCEKCRPNCRQTKYTTTTAFSPLTAKHMEEYRKQYSKELSDTDVFSIVYVYFEMDSVQASRRSARYSIFEEVGLVGGTISMITGLTLLDIIEAIVVIMALIWAQHKIRTRMSRMEIDWASYIPRLPWLAPLPQEMIELPVIDIQAVGPQEVIDQETIDVEPLEPQEIPEQPIIIVGTPGNPLPPIHPLENLPGFIV
ncbi:pickpocket protein 28 [Folsomia candida]|uniref:pickpocket protein 28 n=1 Tax=Folsomia candida TaxID=158441 RepID=UPI000B909153|nr:pickpocket protein 28 [Folsomia candida]